MLDFALTHPNLLLALYCLLLLFIAAVCILHIVCAIEREAQKQWADLRKRFNLPS